MSKPPPTPPSSDITGVNRDARAGVASKSSTPEPGSALHQANEESAAQPSHSKPPVPNSSGAEVERE